jgi:hypothetical protein
MPRSTRFPDALRGEAFRGSQALSEGVITRRQLQHARRLFRDVYADPALDPTHTVRSFAVQRFLLPQGVITGASAAYLYGIRIMADDRPVEAVVPVPHGPIKGVVQHHGPMDPGEVVDRHGIRLTTPVRACWDLTLHRDLSEAVVFVDQFLHSGLVSSAELESYARERQGGRGWRRLLKMAQLAKAGAESPEESRIRVHMVEWGAPEPVTQHVVTMDGRFVARTDLAWPDYRVAVEYDGYAYHSAPSDLARDRARLNALATAGWIVIHVTAGQLRDNPGKVADEVLAALRARGWTGRR